MFGSWEIFKETIRLPGRSQTMPAEWYTAATVHEEARGLQELETRREWR